MDETIREVCEQVGSWAGSDNASRGAVLLSATAVAGVLTVWRWVRGKPQGGERVRIDVNAPTGQEISIQVGRKEDEA